MPELPEVEVVRRGLQKLVVGRTIENVQVLDPRSIRRHLLGVEDFRAQLAGNRIGSVSRRGKFLWLSLFYPADGHATGTALVTHLGMSGQMLMQDPEHADEKHLKVRIDFGPDDDLAKELRFVDQRIFGGMFVSELVPTADGLPGGLGDDQPWIAAEAAHIAKDPLDPNFSLSDFANLLKGSKIGIKRVLLDQARISGVGNIYADESLWASSLHYATPAGQLSFTQLDELIRNVRKVMEASLAVGGTTFDSLYVNVNGASGYFERSLNVYGRENKPCYRCQDNGLLTLIRRAPFMNRSSYLCPVCQPKP
ncbi:formamidopyrimidine-DNA glycosylase [Renibacterium salmoninarum ATCC 33209]|uniref:Formamidopyrimidine-DNA glycosylase n=1 Tax=Renibacterium salmoninarum (strain ATCC 33209 / DSM 20767 / JCM 11484 / NBRC 15589 / NCIMB 2235) TaxID=288705 RepID=A9WMX8_RENSM|nr:bifunctional DNA-formamidopyrimidine glycosylase/DNA-(apurinic or apyrimidinic site) lyase [Renibacterium salmoninarum]ABY23509.1 formamidopyrimidine-DNA glycosylase [Renibacterium salmoninarum ATCC 33209]